MDADSKPDRSPLLELHGASKSFSSNILMGFWRTVVTVQNVAIQIGGGEAVALVGASESGKSTVARPSRGSMRRLWA